MYLLTADRGCKSNSGGHNDVVCLIDPVAAYSLYQLLCMCLLLPPRQDMDKTRITKIRVIAACYVQIGLITNSCHIELRNIETHIQGQVKAKPVGYEVKRCTAYTSS